MTNKATYLTLGILTGATVVSGAVLGAPRGMAETATRNASVTVSEACGFEASGENARTRSLSPSAGQTLNTESNPITTTVFCNRAGGFSVDVVGYSGNTTGNATMIGTSGGTIATATAGTAGGNSYWAVKFAPVAGTYAPTVVSSYQSYNVIPTTATPLISLNGTTTTTTGSSFNTYYQVYAAPNQGAGTYTGQVKYTLSQS